MMNDDKPFHKCIWCSLMWYPLSYSELLKILHIAVGRYEIYLMKSLEHCLQAHASKCWLELNNSQSDRWYSLLLTSYYNPRGISVDSVRALAAFNKLSLYVFLLQWNIRDISTLYILYTYCYEVSSTTTNRILILKCLYKYHHTDIHKYIYFCYMSLVSII